MQSFKLASMVIGTSMVLSLGAFLVPKPSNGANHHANAFSGHVAQYAACIPIDMQWICQ